MIKTRSLGLTALLLIAAAASARAGTEARTGTGGALELRLPTDARGIALGGAMLANVQGVSSLFYNPAGLAATDAITEAQFTYTRYLADMNLNYVAIGHKFGALGSLGFTAKILSIGDIERTTEDAPDGTGEIFSPTFSTLGVTYARQMTDRVNFGITGYYVAERIMQESATGMAFDFGFQYDTGFRGVGLGLAMKNVGPSLKFSGTDFEFNIQRPGDDPNARPRTAQATSSDFELPTYFQFGTAVPLMQGVNRANLYATYQNNSFLLDEYRAGLEWAYRDQVGLRVGWAGTGEKDDLFGFTYGLGVRVPLGESRLYVDYSGQMVDDFFDNVQNVSLRMTF